MKRLLVLILTLGAGAAFAAAPAAARLQAGAATSNITPPIGSLRVGGFAPYPTEHVHDELHARCLVLDDGRTKLALVVCDLLGLHRSVSVEARRLMLNHAMLGYLPTPRQFEFGEYSTWPGTNVLERQASVKMLDALVEMANELKRGAQ